ncbi:MAG: riboflavin synthase [Phycisphaerae bacterium]|nr:riboflavin synthase [Phycisphaerae bacterium]
MFTGIIETTGTVDSLRSTAAGARLVIDAPHLAGTPALGASLCINGVCQSVAAEAIPRLEFDVVPETLRRTTIGRLRRGDVVNLEQALRPSDRLDGHIVQGHVDGIARIVRIDTGAEHLVTLELQEPALAQYLIPKGSIAVDGISLTLASISDRQFSVALIPTTLERTTLGQRRPGDAVNIETDILARTVVSLLQRLDPQRPRPITPEFLQKHGFA